MSLFKTAFIAPTLLAATLAFTVGCGQHDSRPEAGHDHDHSHEHAHKVR